MRTFVVFFVVVLIIGLSFKGGQASGCYNLIEKINEYDATSKVLNQGKGLSAWAWCDNKSVNFWSFLR